MRRPVAAHLRRPLSPVERGTVNPARRRAAATARAASSKSLALQNVSPLQRRWRGLVQSLTYRLPTLQFMRVMTKVIKNMTQAMADA